MHNSTRFLITTLLFLLAIVPAQAQAQQESLDLGLAPPTNLSIEVLGNGIYEVQLNDDALDQTLTDATMEDIMKVVLLSQTHSIPLSKGTTFGYHYKLTGIPEGEQKTLSFELHHPIMITDEGEILEFNSFDQTVSAGGILHDLFVFEKEWEMEKGNYTFKIFFADEIISSIRFDVY